MSQIVYMKQVAPIGAGDNDGYSVWAGNCTNSVTANTEIVTSPSLNCKYASVLGRTTGDTAIATSGHTLTTGKFILSSSTATTGLMIFAVAKPA